MKITIPTHCSGDLEIDAYPTGTPALVVTKPIDSWVRGWKITHRKTGHSVTERTFRTKKIAVTVAGMIGHLDWDFTVKTIPKGKAAEIYTDVITKARADVGD